MKGMVIAMSLSRWGRRGRKSKAPGRGREGGSSVSVCVLPRRRGSEQTPLSHFALPDATKTMAWQRRRPCLSPTVMTLPNAQSRVRDWLFGQALPLWATAGVDAEGRFYEKLDFDGRPVTGLPRRTRVQARQVYVFAEAASLGWAEGEALARRGLEVLIRDNQREDGLWVRTTDDAGAVLDPTPDLYDLAFVLFGLAAAHRVLNDERALPLALATLAATEGSLADPVHGGWQEALPPVLPRRQNPHRHLLEALLFWQAAAPNPVWEDAARRILDLFATRF